MRRFGYFRASRGSQVRDRDEHPQGPGYGEEADVDADHSQAGF